jgi:acyl-CoA thioester hydrolase
VPPGPTGSGRRGDAGGTIPDGARRVAVPLRVRFSETDAMGVANNAAYLAWFEVGRVEYLRRIGHSYAEVHTSGMDMVVVEATVSYLRPLRFDDEFEVECACSDVRGATFRFGYELRRDGEVCASGGTRHACVDRARMRPVRVPRWLAEAVSAPPPAAG